MQSGASFFQAMKFFSNISSNQQSIWSDLTQIFLQWNTCLKFEWINVRNRQKNLSNSIKLNQKLHHNKLPNKNLAHDKSLSLKTCLHNSFTVSVSCSLLTVIFKKRFAATWKHIKMKSSKRHDNETHKRNNFFHLLLVLLDLQNGKAH